MGRRLDRSLPRLLGALVISFALATLPADAHALPLWQDTVHGGGPDGQANAIVTRDGRVFAGGFVATPTEVEGLIRAYDARSGALLWHAPSTESEFYEEVGALAVDDTRLYAASFAIAAAPDGQVWLVRAHDAATGAVLWQDDHQLGRADHAEALAVAGGRVVAVGSMTRDEEAAFAVRTYDDATGTVLWQDDRPESDGSARASVVVATADRVYVAGARLGAPGRSARLVRAYDAASGALMWSDEVPGVAEVDSIQLAGGRLLVGGTVDQVLTVTALDPATGALLWERREPPFGEVAEHDPVLETGMAADASTVVAGRASLLGGRTLFGYDAATGTSRWRRDRADAVLDLTLDGGRVLGIAGSLVRAFGVASGTQLWSTTLGSEASALAIAVDGPLAFVAGVAGAGAGTFHVAAYDTRTAPPLRPIVPLQRLAVRR